MCENEPNFDSSIFELKDAGVNESCSACSKKSPEERTVIGSETVLQSSPSCAPTPPHTVPDEKVVSRPLSRTLFPENRHQFRLLCLDVKYSQQKQAAL